MGFLSEKQQQQFEALCAHEEDCVIVEVTWLMYKDPIAALNHPRKQEGKKLVCKVTGALSKKLPQGLEELAQLGRTLLRRREDILASERRMGRWRRSMDGSSSYAALRWGFATWTTTSCGASLILGSRRGRSTHSRS